MPLRGAASPGPAWSPPPGSDVDGAAGDGEGGFLDGLVEGGVGVAGAGDVLGGTAELHGHGHLVDHGAGVGAEHMAAEHAVAARVGQDLDEAVRVAVAAGAAVG